jgi:type I restriction-modification system DNA methylase subunit
MAKAKAQKPNNSHLGFEQTLWATADKVLPHRLSSDLILTNPLFNMSHWGGGHLRQDVRWKFGMLPRNNAKYAWIQHFIYLRCVTKSKAPS